LEKLKEMKRKVHDSAKKTKAQGFHVKLDEGGIRDVEYFVQMLQLLYGGSHKELRSPSTLQALSALAKKELVPAREASQLKDAYLFLRRLEHRLQLVNEAQTHLMPSGTAEQRGLARRMGYYEDDPEEARERFLDDFTRYTTLVKSTFKNLFE
jgi:glutamate-ammonia-ligase adenylyltransferase